MKRDLENSRNMKGIKAVGEMTVKTQGQTEIEVNNESTNKMIFC